jgi:hypothetical protein
MNLLPLAALAVTALITVSIARPTAAQEYQGCFLLDESGVFRDLSFMCSRPVPAISNRVTTSDLSTNSAFTPSRGQNGFATPYRGAGYNNSSGQTSFNPDGSIDITRGTNFTRNGGINTAPSSSNGRTGRSSGSGNCNLSTDRASDGSLCGGRAASVRPGGR